MPHATSPEPSASPDSEVSPDAKPHPIEQDETSQESEQTNEETCQAELPSATNSDSSGEKTRLEDIFDDASDDDDFQSSNDAPLWVTNATRRALHLIDLQKAGTFCEVFGSRNYESILSTTFSIQIPLPMAESLGFPYQ